MNEAVQLTPMQKYLEDKQSIDAAISLLKYLGGNHLEFNPYKDTILRLEGMISGMAKCEHAVDL